MKKVLFTATVDSHILQFHLPFLKKFKENGYEVHVATNGNEEIPYCDVKHFIPFERNPLKINNIKAIFKLKKICDFEKFDIIHTHTPMGSVVTRLAANKSRKKNHTRVLYTAHGFHFFKGAPIKNWILFYPIEKFLSRFTDTLILINEEDFLIAKRKFKRCNDIKYVPGVGIDENKFDFILSGSEINNLRNTLGITPKDFIMIYPAELSERKRQIWLINTLQEFISNHKDVHLLLPGKDSLNGKCQKLVKDLGLETQIHFLGYRKDIPSLLKISNLALSAANQEGLPVNIMEAMYVGLPIVASNCRGNRDLVADDKNGYLVELKDFKRYSECVEKIYKENKKEFIIESKNIIKEYLLDRIMLSMDKIYNYESKNNKSVAIITSGFLPVPASKGGAAENLLDTIINKNELYNRIKPVIFSSYDEDSIKISMNYYNTDFIFIKNSFISKYLDELIYFFIDKILRRKDSRKFRYIFQRFDFFNKCSKKLKINKYDKVLLENHTIMYLSLKWRKNYLKYKNNYYYHCHNIVPSKYGMANIIKNTKKFISVSEFRNNFVKDFFNVNDEKCSVVLNCCNDDIFKKVSNKEKIDLKEKYKISSEKVIMYVGRIDRDKGTLELIKAVNSLEEKNKYKLLIVGAPIFDTGITTEYENIVKKEMLDNKNIIMTGYVKHDELYKYYSIADLVVIPSQIDDSAPLVLIEALSSGLPVIASDCGGIPEYVNDRCSILIERNKNYIKSLANAIEKTLFNDKILKKMGEESLKQSNNYSAEKYYNDFIDELLN